MNKEDLELQKRFIELSIRSDNNYCSVYTDFLNMAEQSVLTETKKYIPKGIYSFTFGGTNDTERVVACFSPFENNEFKEYPITIIKIEPSNIKFSDNLTHRDYLGAILNLGIDRSKIGDIIISDKEAYVFVKEDIATYILNNLEKIKHTTVRINIEDSVPEKIETKYVEKNIIVASNRLDAIIASMYKLSRSKALEIIKSEIVYVNSKLITSQNFEPNPGDVISVRHMGRFYYDGEVKNTKSGRLVVNVRINEK